MTPRTLALVLLAALTPRVASMATELDSRAYWQSSTIGATRPDNLADASGCGVCHRAQYRAWRDSLHAHAWSPGVRAQWPALDGAARQDCLRCHAPRLAAADSERDHASSHGGVDCAACHVRDGRWYGPRTVTAPHGRVQAHTLFRRAEFCSACHQFGEEGMALNGKPLENTFNEWRGSRHAAAGRTCQSCHMPQGRHAFKGIHDAAMTRATLRVQARRTRTGVRVTATNVGAGHALPTYTTPAIALKLIGGGNAREAVLRRALAWDENGELIEASDTRLLPDASLELELALPAAETAQVEVSVDPQYDYHTRIYPALARAFAGVHDTEKLMRASAQAQRLRYTLYRLRCDRWRGREVLCIE